MHKKDKVAHSTRIARVKKAVRDRDGQKCRDCGMTKEAHIEKYGKQLEVHRLQAGSPYTLEGCITLCFTCHDKRRCATPRYLPSPGEEVLPEQMHRVFVFLPRQAYLASLMSSSKAGLSLREWMTGAVTRVAFQEAGKHFPRGVDGSQEITDRQ